LKLYESFVILVLFCSYVLCLIACMLYELHSMAKVMDPTQASTQLLTELHSRFPEVPVDVIKVIMRKVCLLWKFG